MVRSSRRSAWAGPGGYGHGFAPSSQVRAVLSVTLPAMGGERTIKKYANRRLYDATVSRHVTLEDIRALIVEGEKVRIIEDKTGADITRLILLQVIAEQEQFGQPILTTQLLESIIRVYGNARQDGMADHLQESVETFLRQQDVPSPSGIRKANGSE
jgi:polyhydroxyalkanoate synthesis repressor PhaR